MEKGWVKAFDTSLPYRADIVQAMLTENGVEAVIINKQDTAFISIGRVEIYVPEEKLLRALQLINHDETENENAAELGFEEE